jgi:hypothetical protein
MNKIRIVFALILAGPLVEPNPSSAVGASAVGTTGDIAADGVAVGLGHNDKTREGAAERASAERRAPERTPLTGWRGCVVRPGHCRGRAKSTGS